MNKQLIGKILVILTIIIGLTAFIILAVLDPLPEIGTENNFNQYKNVKLDNSIRNLKFSLLVTDLKIIPVEGDEIKMHLYARKVNTELTIEANQSGDSLKVSIIGEDNLMNISKEIQLTVGLPLDFNQNIYLDLISSDFEMENVTLKDIFIEATSSSCYILKSKLKTLNISTVSGDITLSDVISLNTGVTTTSGDLDFSFVIGNISATSVSGDIEVFYEKNPDKINLSSTSGDIDLQLSKDGFIVKAATVSGDISYEEGLTVQKFSENEINGYYGDKSCIVTIETVSGDTEISF